MLTNPLKIVLSKNKVSFLYKKYIFQAFLCELEIDILKITYIMICNDI